MRGSVIPEGLVVEGELRGQGDLVVAGTIEGPVTIDGHLLIEAGGVIRGEVRARAIVVRGTLHGPAIADETIRLEPGSRMVGDARADRVSVVEGALLRGRITMTGPPPARRSSAGMWSSPGTRSSPGLRSSPGTWSAPGTVPSPVVAPAAVVPSEPIRPWTSAGLRSSPGALASARIAPIGLPDDEGIDEAIAAPPSPRGAVDAAPSASTALLEPSLMPRPASPAPRRPPAPVIPAIGRQRVRRKDPN